MILDWPKIEARARRLHVESERQLPPFCRLRWDELYSHTREAIIWRAMTDEEREALQAESEEAGR